MSLAKRNHLLKKISDPSLCWEIQRGIIKKLLELNCGNPLKYDVRWTEVGSLVPILEQCVRRDEYDLVKTILSQAVKWEENGNDVPIACTKARDLVRSVKVFRLLNSYGAAPISSNDGSFIEKVMNMESDQKTISELLHFIIVELGVDVDATYDGNPAGYSALTHILTKPLKPKLLIKHKIYELVRFGAALTTIIAKPSTTIMYIATAYASQSHTEKRKFGEFLTELVKCCRQRKINVRHQLDLVLYPPDLVSIVLDYYDWSENDLVSFLVQANLGK